MKKVIIIGGGAGGLVAAYTALKNNSEVTIIEKKDRIGSKILATGNGHCNFTNEFLNTDCYYSENSDFIEKAFSIFDNKSTVKLFKEMGVPSRNKNGYLYPYNMEASSVLNALRTVIESEKVSVLTETNLLSVNRNKDKWNVVTDRGTFTGDAVIIACGSNASSKKDINSPVVKQIMTNGHNYIPQKPALTYLKVKEDEIKLASGVRFPVNICLISDEGLVSEESGELQITTRGISGICVFQLSRYVSRNPEKNFSCIIDFVPDYSTDEIKAIVYSKLKLKTAMNIEEMFNGILPKKLTICLSKLVNLNISKPVYMQEAALSRFIYSIKKCELNIIGTGDVSESQCLTGGVSVNEINPLTMESQKCKGLYFCGEIVDIDGKCGGYNLQWAWTSGYIAGVNSSK